MDRDAIAALAKGLVPFVREVTDEKLTPLAARLAELEARPIEKGNPGERGEPGPAGADSIVPGPQGPQGVKGEVGPAGDLGANAMLPPELAAEVARVVRSLHEAPTFAEAPAGQAAPPQW